MKKTTYLSLIAMGVLASACNNYLDVVPKSDVETVESQFEQRTDVYQWLKTCYVMYTDMATQFHQQPGYLGADEFVGGQNAREVKGVNRTTYLAPILIGDGLQMVSSPYCRAFGRKIKHIVSSDIATFSLRTYIIVII